MIQGESVQLDSFLSVSETFRASSWRFIISKSSGPDIGSEPLFRWRLGRVYEPWSQQQLHPHNPFVEQREASCQTQHRILSPFALVARRRSNGGEGRTQVILTLSWMFRCHRLIVGRGTHAVRHEFKDKSSQPKTQQKRHRLLFTFPTA